jgi:hypothetical protein
VLELVETVMTLTELDEGLDRLVAVTEEELVLEQKKKALQQKLFVATPLKQIVMNRLKPLGYLPVSSDL